MATIDLRHLIPAECDEVKFFGAADGKEYTLPVRKTVGMTLLLQRYVSDFNLNRSEENYSTADGIELSLLTLTAWIKGVYPEITIEWVKANIIQEALFIELMKFANELFYPKQTEAPQP